MSTAFRNMICKINFKSITFRNMIFKIKINSTSAENINAIFVENPRYYPKSPETGEEILAIQKHYLRNSENISKKKTFFECRVD